MATTVQSVYDRVCRMLLEDGGLCLVYSEGAFLADLAVAVRTLLQSTGIVKVYDSASVTSGTGTVAIGDEYMEVYDLFWNQRYLLRSFGLAMDETDPFWQSAQKTPEQWREDQLAANTVQIAPKPSANGTLGWIASVQSASATLGMGDNIPYMPDSLCNYLPYMVLAKIFESEGESRDLNRSAYCRARRDECMNIAKAIMAEELMDD